MIRVHETYKKRNKPNERRAGMKHVMSPFFLQIMHREKVIRFEIPSCQYPVFCHEFQRFVNDLKNNL